MKKVIVIGGGAAGMMAAISASRGDNQVLLLERNEKLGKKLFITGKGRCNVTTACAPEEFLSSVKSNPRFLYSSFARFNNEDMIRFLNENGLKTKVERGRRVFPVSDHSSDVIAVLRRVCEKQRVEIRYRARAVKILTDEQKNRFVSVVLENGEIIPGDALILAAGGNSYTSTGSDGDGARLAASLGHTIRPAEPSLVPFVMKETWCRDLMGLTMKNISIKVKNGKKNIYEGFGELLFTHFGVSGPLVLTASTCLGKYQKPLREGKLRLILDCKPALTEDILERRFLNEFDMWKNKNISKVIEQMLPKKMVPVFLETAGIPSDKKVRDITKQERKRMVSLMKGMELHIRDVRGFDEAIVTRGGVHVKEVSPATMESKIIENLYFAGEVLDLDAVTGGYNLQIAWSTGYTAGLLLKG